MTAADVETRLDVDLPTAGAGAGRAAATLQFAVALLYAGGVVAPALVAGALTTGPGDDDSTRLWSESGSAPASIMHILGFFAASVGIAISIVCVPVLLTALVRGWRRQGAATRTLLIASAVLGLAFLAFSATPVGHDLRACIAD
jgi:hypothetical protein